VNRAGVWGHIDAAPVDSVAALTVWTGVAAAEFRPRGQ